MDNEVTVNQSENITVGEKYGCLLVLDTGEEYQSINGNMQEKTSRYKCKCSKCGKIRYYSKETLINQPNYCFRPMYITKRFTYSTAANIATYRKQKKYENDESVQFVDNKDECVPNGKYCDSWNKYRKRELKKLAEKDAKIIAATPRRFAKNYNIDYVGLTYESYEVLECVNEALEGEPIRYKNRDKYHDIIVYKEYRCRCYLCNQERLVKCDEFGIYPPTDYGYRAYDGYWSELYCKCHEISSFQWIVNDILIKNAVEYRVEVSVDGLYGVDNKTPLRFDFAIYNDGELYAFLECQGEQHYKPVREFGGKRAIYRQLENDKKKRAYADSHNIKLIEISYRNKKYDKVVSILTENQII